MSECQDALRPTRPSYWVGHSKELQRQTVRYEASVAAVIVVSSISMLAAVVL